MEQEQEPVFGPAEAPATKGDVRTAMRAVSAEVHALRAWVEGEFKAARQEVRALIAESDGRMLRYVVGLFVVQVGAFYAIQRLG